MRSKYRYLLLPLLVLALQVTASLALASVTLVSFTAVPDRVNRKITLYWETGSELDFAGFYIQRSFSSDSGFKRLLDINGEDLFFPAQGEGGAGAVYMQYDNRVNIGVVYYYRLEMVDLDGGSNYSDIISSTLGSLIYLPFIQK
jgi:hypothetical protein